MDLKTLNNQTLLDIAIQSGGSVNVVFDLAIENEISITDSLEAGKLLRYQTISEPEIVNYYKYKGLLPATAIIDTRKQGGIGYMAVRIDFIVS